MLVVRALELRLAALLGLEQVHLHARVEVDAPSPLVSTGQKMVPGNFSVMSDCTPSDTPALGMQPKGFTLSVMCALLMHDVHDQLADLHVAFAAAEIVVVVLVATSAIASMSGRW